MLFLLYMSIFLVLLVYSYLTTETIKRMAFMKGLISK
jgi:hypothetical protein